MFYDLESFFANLSEVDTRYW